MKCGSGWRRNHVSCRIRRKELELYPSIWKNNYFIYLNRNLNSFKKWQKIMQNFIKYDFTLFFPEFCILSPGILCILTMLHPDYHKMNSDPLPNYINNSPEISTRPYSFKFLEFFNAEKRTSSQLGNTVRQ
jgi:hypothetical protein